MASRIGLVMVLSSDTARARAFYSDLLGYEQVDQLSSPDGEFLFLHSSAGGPDIAIQDAAKQDYGIPSARGGLSAAFIVDDADATYAAWQAKEVEFVSEVIDIGAGRMFTVKDPDGNYIEVYHLNPDLLAMRKQIGWD
ncbi:MAG TPA: VOC family protein [Ktedonobacterales bacterium]